MDAMDAIRQGFDDPLGGQHDHNQYFENKLKSEVTDHFTHFSECVAEYFVHCVERRKKRGRNCNLCKHQNLSGKLFTIFTSHCGMFLVGWASAIVLDDSDNEEDDGFVSQYFDDPPRHSSGRNREVSARRPHADSRRTTEREKQPQNLDLSDVTWSRPINLNKVRQHVTSFV